MPTPQILKATRRLKPSGILDSLIKTRTFSSQNDNKYIAQAMEREGSRKEITQRIEEDLKTQHLPILRAKKAARQWRDVLATSDTIKLEERVKRIEQLVSKDNPKRDDHNQDDDKNASKTAYERLSAVEQRVNILEISKIREDFERGNLQYVVDAVRGLQDQTSFLGRRVSTQAQMITDLQNTVIEQKEVINSLRDGAKDLKKQERSEKNDAKKQMPFVERVKQKGDRKKQK